MDTSSFFTERINQYQKNIYQKLVRGNIFKRSGLVPMSAFDLSEGRVPIVRTLTHELPTAYPTSMTEVTLSTGSGNAICNPTATTIATGEIQRTFKLYSAAFQSNTFCLSDLVRAEQLAEVVGAAERGFAEYLDTWWADWHRIQNIGMIDNKVSTDSATSVSLATSTAANHTGVSAVPTVDLNWGHLKQLYWDLIRKGLASDYAIGLDSKGQPVFPFVAGPALIERLFTDDDVKDTVKYFDPKSNLSVLGYNGAVRGFLPLVDPFPIRYGKSGGLSGNKANLTATNMVYPFENVAATSGKKYQFKTNYLSTARGGLAEYEVATIMGPQVYEAKFEPVAAASPGKMSFNPQNYIGEFQFINNRTFQGDNDRGNLGYYLADVRCGAKPIFPENGVSILTLAVD